MSGKGQLLGRLKEQDHLISLIRLLIVGNHDGLSTMSVTEAFAMVEKLVHAHVKQAKDSRLSKYAPGINGLHLKLELVHALQEYNTRTGILLRRHVPPTFKEVRHVVNIATVHALVPFVKMVTLDADDTIYEDGGVISMGSPMVNLITRMLRAGLHVALVTAAGYPGQVQKYEQRLRGLMDAFQLAVEMGAPKSMLSKFFVMGGECNYLHSLVVEDGTVRLAAIPDKEWKDGRGVRWGESDIEALLDCAQETLKKCAEAFGMSVTIIRKERAVGFVRNTDKRISYELLEEIAMQVQAALKKFDVPHCAFNGGNDVWVDVGNKALGIRALQAFLGPRPHESVHVGDRFTRTGNDNRARDVSSTLWVSNPQETEFVLKLLLRGLNRHKQSLEDRATPTRPRSLSRGRLPMKKLPRMSTDVSLSARMSAPLPLPTRLASLMRTQSISDMSAWQASGGRVVGNVGEGDDVVVSRAGDGKPAVGDIVGDDVRGGGGGGGGGAAAVAAAADGVDGKVDAKAGEPKASKQQPLREEGRAEAALDTARILSPGRGKRPFASFDEGEDEVELDEDDEEVEEAFTAMDEAD